MRGKVDIRINTCYAVFEGNKMTANEIKKLLKKAGYEIIAGAKHDKLFIRKREN